MKTLLITIFCLLSIPASYGSAPQAFPLFGLSLFASKYCEDPSFINILQELNPLFKTKCQLIEGEEKEYCKCLNSKQNILTEGLRKSQGEEYQKKLAEYRQEQRNRLMNTYAQTNFGAKLQEKMFDIKRGKETACTPDRFSKHFYDSLCSESSDDPSCPNKALKEVNEEDVSSISSSLKNCKDNCDPIYEDINQRYLNAKNMNSSPLHPEAPTEFPVSEKGLNQGLSQSFSPLQRPMVDNTVNSFCTMDGCTNSDEEQEYNTKSTDFSKMKHVDPKSVKNMLNFFKQHKKLIEPAKLSLLESLGSKKNKEIKYMGRILTNNEVDEVYNDLVMEYNFKSTYVLGDDFRKDSDKQAKTSHEYKLYKKMREVNEQITDKMKENFSSVTENNCIRYDHYKVLSSLPSPELLDSWGTMDYEQIADQLDPKNLTANHSSHALNYIKNNPMLAKLVVSPKSRQELAEKLKKLAFNSKGKSKGDQLKNYYAFMQQDVAPLLNENKISDLYQCHMLSRNMAAVFSSNSLPNQAKLTGEQGFEGISSDYLSCQVLEQKEKSNDDIEGVMAYNQLFSILGNDSRAPEELGPDNDQGYIDFNKENCQGFDDYRKEYIDKYCTIALFGKKTCMEKFLSVRKNRSKRMLKSYYDAKNQELGELIGIISDNNSKNFDPDDYEDLFDEENQDKTATDYYDNHIRDMVNDQPLHHPPSSGPQGTAGSSGHNTPEQMYSFLDQQQQKYEESVGYQRPGSVVAPELAQAPVTPEQGAGGAVRRSPASNSPVSNDSQPVVNPGQVVPGFFNSQAPVSAPQEHEFVAPPQVNSLEDVREIVKNSEKYSPEDQHKAIQDAQDFVDSYKGNRDEIAELQKKLDQMEDEIEEAQNKPGSSHRNVAGIPGNAPHFSQNSNINSFGLNKPSVSSVGRNSSPGSGTINGGIDKAAMSYQKALNQMNERQNVETIEISNLVGPKELGASFITVDTSLNVESSDFQKILESKTGDELKQYLMRNKHLLPESGFISIKCSKGCSSNSNEILVQLERGPSNTLIVRGVKPETPVVNRVHMLDNLTNQLNVLPKSTLKR